MIETQAILKTIHAPDSLDQTLWEQVSQSIRSISNRVQAWGSLLKATHKPPDITTMQEIAHDVDDLELMLSELDRWLWLYKRRQNVWGELRQGLRDAQQSYWNPENKASFSTYLHWLENAQKGFSISDIRTIEVERFKAGESLINFGEALADAVIGAEAYLNTDTFTSSSS